LYISFVWWNRSDHLAITHVIGDSMDSRFRRDFLKMAGMGAACAVTAMNPAALSASPSDKTNGPFANVRDHGAAGDGKTIDTPAINRTIDAATAAGGGTVYFPAGQYLCYS